MALYDTFERLLTFVSIYHAIRAERLLVEAGLVAVILPTPRALAVSCGQSLLVYATEQEAMIRVLAAANVRWSKLYAVERHKTGKVYRLLADYEEG